MKWKCILGVVVFIGAQVAAFADVAFLAQVGPESEPLAANPGVVDSKAKETKINMEEASVQITLSKGEGDVLHADFNARFVMQNLERKGEAASQNIVAFPATGLDAKLIKISNFQVSVNGKTPPTILRKTVVVSRHEVKTADEEVSGKWEASYNPEAPDRDRDWNDKGLIKLRHGESYDYSYLWVLRSEPGNTDEIIVTYQADIQLQRPTFRKAYSNRSAAHTSIPFESFPLEDDPEGYYLFDYVLLSGSTWFGPIGKETISISFASNGAQLNRAIALHKRVYAWPWAPRDQRRDPDENSIETERGNGNELIYKLSGRPEYDLLISVKKSLLK